MLVVFILQINVDTFDANTCFIDFLFYVNARRSDPATPTKKCRSASKSPEKMPQLNH